MLKHSQPCLIACVLLVALLGGCATRTPPDVGSVVLLPQVRLPPPPVIVQQTQPKPMGWYQSRLADYFSNSQPAPIK